MSAPAARTRARAVAAGAVALTVLLAAGAAPAAADFEPARLVSASAQEQAVVATQPAISADGRYVVFAGELSGLKGVFRRTLASGEVELVAGADAYDASDPAGDAAFPSISAHGRYVSFTTRAPLDPAHDPNTARDVYVRDMGAPAPPTGRCAAGDACAFELASASDGSRDALAYGSSLGSLASARVALSADGRRVAFVVAAVSNLAGADTPARQVALRDLDARRTILVSARRDPASGAMTALPVAGGAVAATAGPAVANATASGVLGATLSADGTTVAWLGTAIDEQAPVLSQELVDMQSNGYTEPLWRRVADGPAAPTRRIVGGADPLAPGCPPDGSLAIPACRGPFDLIDKLLESGEMPGWTTAFNQVNAQPQLSADGRTVATVGDPTWATNVWVVDMRDGLTRTQAMRQLTREIPVEGPGDGNTNIATDGHVWDVAISPDGRRIAFASARTRYPLAPPNLVGGVPSRSGLTELWQIDLDAGVLERVTAALDGGPSGPIVLNAGLNPWGGSGAFLPSYSGDGRTLAFGSDASNLVAGDANGARDVFAVTERVVPELPGATWISSPPGPEPVHPRWRISARAFPRPDGSVVVAVTAPGAGTARVRARAALTVGRGARRTLRTREVAAARTSTRRGGPLKLTLRLDRRYRALARRRGGLDAELAVTFARAGRTPAKDALQVTFRAKRGHAR